MTSTNPYALETLSNLLKDKVIIVTGGKDQVDRAAAD